MELQVTFDLSASTSKDFCIEFFNSRNEFLRLGYDRTNNRFYIDRTKAGKHKFSDKFAAIHTASRSSTDSIPKLHLFLDVDSVELLLMMAQRA